MNSRGFFFYYFGTVILLIISCLTIGVSSILGTTMVLTVLLLQVFIYFATKISTRQLLWQPQYLMDHALSHCDGKIEEIISIKEEKIREILSTLGADDGNNNEEKGEDWYAINIVNHFPQFPDRRSPLEGKIKIFNLLTKKIKALSSRHILKKYENYNFWYQIKSTRKGHNNKKIFLLLGDYSLQKGAGIAEFVPFTKMLNDCSELLYPSLHGSIQQTELISAIYFYSKTVIFLPAKYFDLQVVKNQTLIAGETIIGTFKKTEMLEHKKYIS
jgi:hypothetical protein